MIVYNAKALLYLFITFFFTNHVTGQQMAPIMPKWQESFWPK